MNFRRADAAAAASGAATFAVYMLGAGRSLDYDSSVTVGTFVATPSLLDPFRKQLVFNNHPLFSFLEHLVWSAGGRSEAALRVLPVALAAITVALVVGWAGRRWNLRAGLVGGAVLAVSPTFAELARSVRGYSLLALCATASTLLLPGLLARRRGRREVAYVLVAAAGLATHLWFAFVLVGHVAAVCARGRPARRWGVVWGAAASLGATAYVGVGPAMASAAAREQGRFRPRFPLEAARALLGHERAAAVGLAALAVAGSAIVLRRELVAGAAAILGALALTWIVLAPADLYPRFLVWLVPGLALLAAAAASRWRLAAAVAACAVTLAAAAQAAHWTQAPLASRAAAQLVESVRDGGGRACVLPFVRGALMAYIRPPREAVRASRLRGCDVAIGSPANSRALRRQTRARLPWVWTLRARTNLLVYSRDPPATFAGERPD